MSAPAILAVVAAGMSLLASLAVAADALVNLAKVAREREDREARMEARMFEPIAPPQQWRAPGEIDR